MPTKLLFAALTALILLLPLGCDQPGEADYFPLAEGYRWEYACVDLRITTGATDTLYRWAITVGIPGRAALYTGDSAWISVMDDDGDIDTTYYREDSDRILHYADPDDDEPTVFLSLPLEQDGYWMVDEDIAAHVTGKVTLTTPAGTYKNSWDVAWVEDGDTTRHFWFAPNVGIAREEERRRTGDTTYLTRRDLKSFTTGR